MIWFLIIALSFLPMTARADSEITIGGKTAQAHIIQDEGVNLRPRPYLNFVGNITCADSNGKTVCTVSDSLPSCTPTPPVIGLCKESNYVVKLYANSILQQTWGTSPDATYLTLRKSGGYLALRSTGTDLAIH